MKKRLLVIGILAGSLAIALPAQASYAGNELPAGAFVLAKRSADDGDRAEERRRADSRGAQRRDGDERGYGYGYERRQRGGEAGDDSSSSRRNRGQVEPDERRESRDSRGGRR